MKISDIIDRTPVIIEAGDTLSSAAKRMAEKKISCAPVVSMGKLLGLITTSDLAAALVKESVIGRPKQADTAKARTLPAGKHLSQKAFWLLEDASVFDAIVLLVHHQTDMIPIADKKGKFTGIVWAEDVRKEIAAMLIDSQKGANEGKETKGAKGAAAASASASSPAPGTGAQDQNEGRTAIDKILRYVDKKGSANASEIAKQFSLPISEVEEYAMSLEKHGLLTLDYDILGKMKLRKKDSA
ncbi:MAG: CBS domain-containing protein [Candidatus Micrarchaeota archaeon]|nr:CBS domain-containing protein [Candidatus Micrarchaeota archaeon]